ncbi:MAG: Hydroxyacylglutathione hydrolase, partial [uncultured bacterium]
AFNDNYIWALVDDDRQQAIIVDPGGATPVLAFLAQRKLMISAILITHKHHDHTGGIPALLDAFPNALVFANSVEGVECATQTVSDKDVITINDHIFKVIAIPGHTLGHVAYYCKPYLFCGDTLFTNGCGRIFEGTAEQMLSSLKKLMALPDDTFIYCGHEYTLSNIKFALHIESNNIELQKRFEEARRLRSENKPTVPSTLKLEKDTNPFLRCSEPSVIEAVSNYIGKKLNSESQVFYELRQWKNAFS